VVEYPSLPPPYLPKRLTTNHHTTYARQHKTNQNPLSIQIGRKPSSPPPAPVIKAICLPPPAVCREKYSKVVQKSLDIKMKF